MGEETQDRKFQQSPFDKLRAGSAGPAARGQAKFLNPEFSHMPLKALNSSFGGCGTAEAVPFVGTFNAFARGQSLICCEDRFFEFDDLPTQAKRGLNGPPEHSEFGKGLSREL